MMLFDRATEQRTVSLAQTEAHKRPIHEYVSSHNSIDISIDIDLYHYIERARQKTVQSSSLSTDLCHSRSIEHIRDQVSHGTFDNVAAGTVILSR